MFSANDIIACAKYSHVCTVTLCNSWRTPSSHLRKTRLWVFMQRTREYDFISSSVMCSTSDLIVCVKYSHIFSITLAHFNFWRKSKSYLDRFVNKIMYNNNHCIWIRDGDFNWRFLLNLKTCKHPPALLTPPPPKKNMRQRVTGHAPPLPNEYHRRLLKDYCTVHRIFELFKIV